MKNILTFLTLLMLFFSVGWAETAEFTLRDFTNGAESTSQTVNGITLTFAKGSGQNVTVIDGAYFHVTSHPGNTITVDGGTSTITEIKLDFYNNESHTLPEGSCGISPTNSGIYAVNQVNQRLIGTWTATDVVNSVTLTNNSDHDAYIYHVTVTYRPKVQTPVITINPASGRYYVGDNVTASIACGTADATISYKINDGEWTECNGSVTITSETPGNVTIQAIAKKDGCNNSEVAEKTITFVPIPVLNNLAEVNALKDGDKFKFEADITASPVVLGKRNNDLYIVMPDNSAGALVYKAGGYWDDTYTYGKIINSGWTGEKTTYNGRPEVRNTENFSVSDVSSDLVAIQILSNSDLSLGNFGRFAVIKGVKVAPTGTFSELTTYDEFGVMSQVVDEGKYDVSGVIGWENGTGVFMPLWYNNYEPAHTITVTQPVGGTISADIDKAYSGERVNLTANPAAAYQFGSWIVKDENDNGVAVTENHFTMPKSDVTVTAQFTLKPTYAITVEGGTANPTAAYEGQTVTVTPTIPEGKLFDSYTVTPSTVTLTESGNGYTFTMPAEPVTVTFNYKDDPAWTNHFERITDTDQLEAGVRYLLVYENGNSYAVLGGINSRNPNSGSAVTGSSNFTYSDGVVDLKSATAMPVTLGGASGAWTFKTGGKYLYSAVADGLNTQETNGNNGIWNISFDGNNAVIKNNSNLTIYYNDQYPERFAGYTESGQGLHPIQLYKETTPPAEDDVYSLVGNNADIFGAAWYTENENTVMSPSSNNVYTWTNPKFPIRSNNWGVQYKVIKNHEYSQGQWPKEGNANYTINYPGWYSMTFTFELNNNNVYASVTRLGDVCTVAGATNGEGSANVDDPFFGKTWKADANEMSTNDYTNYIWTSAPVELSSGNSVAFKVVKNNSQWIGNGDANIVCTAPEDGTYVLKVTYNASSGVVGSELIKKVDTYTVAGSAIGETIEAGHGKEDALFGTAWEPTLTANDMTLVDGLYTWSKTGVELDYGTLSYGNIAFRICEDHSLDHTYPVGGADRIITTVGSGVYDVTITFNPETKEIVAIATAHVSTLKDLCLTGKNGGNYVIEESLLGVYKKDNTVWFKDANGSAIDYQTPGAELVYWINNVSSKEFDQSNWIEVVFPSEENYDEIYIKNLTGTYSYNGGNRKLTITNVDALEENGKFTYTPNPYIPANFAGTQKGYFFSKPKVQEYAHFVKAQWNGSQMVMTTDANDNPEGFTGSFSIMPVDGLDATHHVNDFYEFHGIVRKGTVGSPRLQAEGGIVVEATDLDPDNVVTAISTVGVNVEVKSVKYVSVACVVSDRPFQGVNIVVTEYSDGSRTTAKVVK